MNKYKSLAFEAIALLNEITNQIDLTNLNEWGHSDIEDWKIDLPYFSDVNHIINFRRSITSGGTLNPPDRPYKVSKKYHGIEEDVSSWFDGLGVFDKLKGVDTLLKLYSFFSRRIKTYKLESLDSTLRDNMIGNPCYYKIPFFGRVTEASTRFWYYSTFISNKFNNLNNVLEIGSGYGGLSSVIFNSCNSDRYFLVDLPENLSLAYYYHKCLGNEIQTIFKDQDLYKTKNKGIFLIAPFMLHEINIKLDLVINTMSFQHMTKKNIDYYFRFINEKEILNLYYVNRTIKRDESDVVEQDYPIDKKFILTHDEEFFSVHKEKIYSII